MDSPVEQERLFAEEALPSISDISREQIDLYLQKTAATTIPDLQKTQLLNGLSPQYPFIFAKGDLGLLSNRIVSVVGTRTPSENGSKRAAQVAKILVENKFVVMSGLAKGIDTVAHSTTLQLDGKTIAVLGTPIHKIYPAENKNLADKIAERGLLLSPSLPHEETGRFLFPRRNRLMARLSMATIVIEAGPTSGVIHQAAECLRQNKKLIFLKSLADNKSLEWVSKFIKSGALVVETSSDLSEALEK